MAFEDGGISYPSSFEEASSDGDLGGEADG
jgi:hypothetical protein